MDRLRDGAEECFQAFLTGDLDTVGRRADEYWELKKRMSPGNEPAFVARLRAALQGGPNPVLSCSSLAGAGGGGFLYGLLAKGVARETLMGALAAIEGSDEARIYEARLDYNGLYFT